MVQPVLPTLLKVSMVIISDKTEESGGAMVQHLKVHHCAVTRYQTGGGLHLGKQHPHWLSCQRNLDWEYVVKSQYSLFFSEVVTVRFVKPCGFCKVQVKLLCSVQ